MPRKRPKDMRVGIDRPGKRGGRNSRGGKTDPTLTPLSLHPSKRPRTRK